MKLFLILLLFCKLANAQTINLAWDISPQATGYYIHWGIGSKIDVGNTTSYKLDVQTGVQKTYSVSAYNQFGESSLSEEISPILFRLQIESSKDWLKWNPLQVLWVVSLNKEEFYRIKIQ